MYMHMHMHMSMHMCMHMLTYACYMHMHMCMHMSHIVSCVLSFYNCWLEYSKRVQRVLLHPHSG